MPSLELVRNYDDDTTRRAELIQRIGDTERSADKVTYETVSLLHSTFITPFDRNDIHRLISAMDDVLDLMQDAAESMHMFDIQTLPPESLRLAELLQQCCVKMAAGGRAAEFDGERATRARHSRRRSTGSRAKPTRSRATAFRACSAKNRTCASSSSTRTSTSTSRTRSTSARTWPMSSKRWSWKTSDDGPDVSVRGAARCWLRWRSPSTS